MSTNHRHSLTNLLLLARSVVLLRRRRGRYPELSDAATNVVVNGLTGVAVDPAGAPVGLRDDAAALAHRLIDDDRPEDSPLWPAAGDELRVTNWWQLTGAVDELRTPVAA